MPMPTLTEVGSERGAPMGRPDCHDPNRLYAGQFLLQKLRMSGHGDYDYGGAYWGAGDPKIGWMYRAYSPHFPEFHVDLFFRARSREEAKQYVRKLYPNAVFHR